MTLRPAPTREPRSAVETLRASVGYYERRVREATNIEEKVMWKTVALTLREVLIALEDDQASA